MRRKQIPGQLYTFIKKVTKEQDTGILPSCFGDSNDFACWVRSGSVSGGSWRSRKFADRLTKLYNLGKGPLGLRGRASYLLLQGRSNAKKREFVPVNLSAEELTEILENFLGKCGICAEEFSVFKVVIEHDHLTGKFRGLVCQPCNAMLGMSKDNPKILRLGAVYLERKLVTE